MSDSLGVIPPPQVTSKIEDFVGDRLGIYFESWNVKFHSAEEYPKNRWTLEYRFHVAEAPWVAGRIRYIYYIDSTGAPPREVIGVPDCATDPKECQFGVDQKRAIQIAKDVGLDPGVEAWKPWFMWAKRHRTYVWMVTTILRKSHSSRTYQTLYIDANDGEVLELETPVIVTIHRI